MIEIFAQIKDGVILKKLGVDDGSYLIKISKSSKRTNPMNSYLHGILIPEFRKALNSVGYDEVKTDEQSKLIMKAMFLSEWVTNEKTGEIIKFVADTHNLTKLQMSSLFDDVIKFCAENMNYTILYPGETLTLNFDE